MYKYNATEPCPIPSQIGNQLAISKAHLKSKAARRTGSYSQNRSKVPRHSIQQGVKLATTSCSIFVKVPLEVFSEIIANLGPTDLLSLARTSKIFRRILMSRASRHSWQMALKNVLNLPPCPSDMCEPKYASFIFSETCSTCAVRVFRGIDPILRVRLCRSCFNKETVPIDRYDQDHTMNLVPKSGGSQSEDIGWIVHPYLYTLRSEVKYVKHQLRVAPGGWNALEKWRNTRAEEMRKRGEHATALRRYLDWLDIAREKELNEQEAVAKSRLASVGWSQQDMAPAPANWNQWKGLIRSPSLLSSANWTRIYPKLVLLMWSNRAHHKQKEWRARQDRYITELHHLATDIQDSLPLLHRVTIQSGSDHRSMTPKVLPLTKFRSVKEPNRRDTAQLFPSMVEFQELPIIRDLLAKDVGMNTFRTTLQGCRRKVEQAIEQWRDGVEEELLSILNSASTDPNGDNPNLLTRPTNLRIHNRVDYLHIRPPGSLNDTTVPKVKAIFPQPNLACTSDISQLPPTTQTLLRADSKFIRRDMSLNYPLVCFSKHRSPPFSVKDRSSYGVRWNADLILPDAQGSLICRRLLVDLGRPNAIHAELSIIGNNYKCGRCGYPPTIWEVLVGHYRKELDQWKIVESASKKKRNSYQNPHDLAPRPDKPLAYLVSLKEAHKTFKLPRFAF